jgi:hypothetical protein
MTSEARIHRVCGFRNSVGQYAGNLENPRARYVRTDHRSLRMTYECGIIRTPGVSNRGRMVNDYRIE